MKAIFGLGNVGDEYTNTRHNIGFLILDLFLNYPTFENNKKIKALTFKFKDSVFVKPTSFMNTSGEVVKNVCKFYSIPTDQIIVIHDDIDQKVGSYKIVNSGGSGGQKGVENIKQVLGTDVFCRLKLGVAPDFYNPSTHKAEDFVLKRFSEQELQTIKTLFSEKLETEINRFLNPI